MKLDVIMTGETNRDWQSFVAVCEQLSQINFAAVLPAEQAGRMPSLPNLRTFERLPFAEYCHLIAQSTIQLILVRDHGVAVGQRDFLLAGRLGVPVISTSVESMRIYDPCGDCALFVEQGDVKGICDAVNRLLGDAGLRTRLTLALKKRIEESHSLARVSSQWAMNLGADVATFE
jgi:glycosyltransferase involved in cell wall biosynthesis